MVTALKNATAKECHAESPHQPEAEEAHRRSHNRFAPTNATDVTWYTLTKMQHTSALTKVGIYLDKIISVVQRGLNDFRQMIRYLFHIIEHIL